MTEWLLLDCWTVVVWGFFGQCSEKDRCGEDEETYYARFYTAVSDE
jgi:hypothetical protein